MTNMSLEDEDDDDLLADFLAPLTSKRKASSSSGYAPLSLSSIDAGRKDEFSLDKLLKEQQKVLRVLEHLRGEGEGGEGGGGGGV